MPFLAIGKEIFLPEQGHAHRDARRAPQPLYDARQASKEGHDDLVTALAKHIRKLPEQLRRSLTWDQGKEMSGHKRFTVATNVQVYFCDPRSPSQLAATRTPSACCDSTSREEPISRASPRPT